MTKTEMLKIAELVYSHYNERVPSTAPTLKKTMLAWEHALKDVEYSDAYRAVSQLVLVEHFQLRRIFHHWADSLRNKYLEEPMETQVLRNL